MLASVVAVGIAQLLTGWMPLMAAVVLLIAAVWIRVGILQPISSMLSLRRRLLTRWTARLLIAAALAATVILVEALTLVPVVGLPIQAAISSIEVALVAWAVTAYVHWQVDREAAGREVARWEWLVLALCLVIMVLAVLALVWAVVALASVFDTVLGWLR